MARSSLTNQLRNLQSTVNVSRVAVADPGFKITQPDLTKANKLSQLSQSLLSFNPALEKFKQQAVQKESVARDVSATLLNITGGNLENQEAFRKMATEGLIHPGANPNLLAAGSSAKGFNLVATGLREQLGSKFLEMSSPDITSEQAVQEVQRITRDFINGNASDPFTAAAIIKAAPGVQAEFLQQTQARRLAARQEEAETNIAIGGTDVLRSISSGEIAAQDQSTFMKQYLDFARQSGVPDTNNFFVKKVVAPYVAKTSAEDPEQALHLLDLVEDLDVTGTGGTLGKIGTVSMDIENLRSMVEGIQADEQARALKLQKQQREALNEEGNNMIGQFFIDNPDPTEHEIAILESQVLRPLVEGRRDAGELMLQFGNKIRAHKNLDPHTIETSKEKVLEALFDGRVDIARQLANEAVEAGTMSAAEGINIKNQIQSFDSLSRVDFRGFIENKLGGLNVTFDRAFQVPAEQAKSLNEYNLANQDEVFARADLRTAEATKTVVFEARRLLSEEAQVMGVPLDELVADPVKLAEAQERIVPQLREIKQRAEDDALRRLQKDLNENVTSFINTSATEPGWFGGTPESDLMSYASLVNRANNAGDSASAAEYINEISKLRSDLEDELQEYGEDVDLTVPETVNTYFKKKSAYGYVPSEITSGRTLDGVIIDNPSARINPYTTPVFRSSEQIQELLRESDETGEPSEGLLILAETLNINVVDLISAQIILLNNRGL